MNQTDSSPDFGDGTIRVELVEVQEGRQGSMLHWFLPAIAALVVLLAVIVVYRAQARVESDEDPTDPTDPTVINGHGGGFDPEESARLEGLREVPLDPRAERGLIAILKCLETHADADHGAAQSLNRLDERIAALDARIKQDIETGGVLSDRNFRYQWALVRSSANDETHRVPEPDKTLADDVSLRRKITRGRLVQLVDFIEASRMRLMRRMTREEMLRRFVGTLPAPGRSLLCVGDRWQLEGIFNHRENPKLREEAIGGVGEDVYLPLPPGKSHWNTQADKVDKTDMLLIACLDRGIVNTAYEPKSLDGPRAKAELMAAEKFVRDLLAGRSPEFGATEPPPKKKEPDRLFGGLSGGPDIDVNSPEFQDAVKERFEQEFLRQRNQAGNGKDEGKSQSGPVTEIAVPTPPTSKPAPISVVDMPKEPVPPGAFRQWWDVRGHTCYARLVKVEGSEVLIEDPKGVRGRFLATNFCPDDQEYLRPFLEAQPKKKAAK